MSPLVCCFLERVILILKSIFEYSDDRGNRIVYEGATMEGKITVNFRGINNTLKVGQGNHFDFFSALFDCDNGLIEIGNSYCGLSLSAFIRVGQDSSVEIGDDSSSTSMVNISAAEGSTVRLGNKVTMRSSNYILSDDSHPIFSVLDGSRVNSSRDIHIDDNVFLADGVAVLGGSFVGKNSLLSRNTVVKRTIPNNCLVSGSPAKIVAKNVSWENTVLLK
ncbi:acyltransferase [Arthrobacter psychrolactophilus]|uniref:acyltransferase n=1 Tax=Arthrobacter psychrolactophilus TaxID=92442 RepID=UPI001C64D79A|nr:acyltransferase [Arthrobacter psychrolactophilus]